MLTSSGTVRHFGQVAILSGLLALSGAFCPSAVQASDLSLPITGNLVGSVVDSQGVPQMGATVQLLNKYHQAIAKATSDSRGHFAFASLPEDLYSLRASLASFLPVSRDRVNVKAGLDSVLQIHLATLISSVELSYIIPSSAMSEDWKWVLRSSNATRPVNRYLPLDLPSSSESTPSGHNPIFTETHAALSLSGGDAGPLDADSSFSDFGTAFALSTQVFGKNRIQVSGSFGDDGTISTPAISISAIYSHNSGPNLGNPPEITFNATQIAGLGTVNVPGGSSITGNPSRIALRTMSLSLYETLDPLANLHLEYGVTGESVDYLQHTNRISPFARMTLDEGSVGQVLASYSDGGRPDQLLRHSTDAPVSEEEDADSGAALSAGLLQRIPQISSRNGTLVLQRTRSYEVGYRKVAGSRTYAFSAFAENVNDGRLSVAGDFSAQIAPDILSDTLSRTAVYNTGRYRRTGYMGSVTQRWGAHVETGLAYGRMGAFQADLSQFSGTDPRFLRQRNARFASVNIKGVVPRLGTKVQADYGWIDSGTVMPRHTFTTQSGAGAPGLNIYVRQPVPTFLGLPGRLELTADLRNLLAQGYLPVNSGGGRQLLIVQAPQSVRGGLNFIF